MNTSRIMWLSTRWARGLVQPSRAFWGGRAIANRGASGGTSRALTPALASARHHHHLGVVVGTGRRRVSYRSLIQRRSANKVAACHNMLPSYMSQLANRQVLHQMRNILGSRMYQIGTSTVRSLHSTLSIEQKKKKQRHSLANLVMNKEINPKKLYIKTKRNLSSKACKRKKSEGGGKISVKECCKYADKRVKKALNEIASLVKCKVDEMTKPPKKSKSAKKPLCKSKKKKSNKSCKSLCKPKEKKKKKAKKSKSCKSLCKSKSAPAKKKSSKKIASKKCKSDSSLKSKGSKKLDKDCNDAKKKKKKKISKVCNKKNYTKHLCKKRPGKKKKKKKSLEDLCKELAKKESRKKKKSSKSISKKKSNKSVKKKSSKDICKKKSSKDLKQKKSSSKSICKPKKKKSSKSLSKKKKSAKIVCKKKKKSLEELCKELAKKESSKKKKSSKSICKKKSNKSVKKKSSKDICKKKSSKDLKKKSSSENICKPKKKKSSKSVCKKKKKSLEELCKELAKKESSKKKKSSKSICKKKSSKSVKKKSSKDICKKKSSKDLKKKKSSSKNICKPKKKKSSKSVCKKKKKSLEELCKELAKKESSKKKKSSKSICKKKSSKSVKKKSSKNICKKKSKKRKTGKELCAAMKKASKEKKSSKKNLCKKKSSKKLKKKKKKVICSKAEKGKKNLSKPKKKKKKIKKSENICNPKKKKSSSKSLKKKKSSSQNICKPKKSKSCENLKKKKSSSKKSCKPKKMRHSTKKKSSKKLKKESSSKSVCKPKKKKSSKDISKKKSSKNLKKKKSSSKSICKPKKKKSSKNVSKSSKKKKKKPKKVICSKAKRSRKGKKKKSLKDLCKKKSSKKLKKKSSKDICKKKKKSLKDLCKEESSKKIKRKKSSSKSVCKSRKKKSSKSVSKGKSSKKLKNKKFSKDICKKKKSRKVICSKAKKKSKKGKKKKRSKCNQSKSSVGQHEYCQLSKRRKSNDSVKLPCNAKLKSCPPKKKRKAICDAQHEKDKKIPKAKSKNFCKITAKKFKKGKKRKKKKKKKDPEGMTCYDPKKDKKEDKCKKSKKKCISGTNAKIGSLDGTGGILQEIKCPGSGSTGNMKFMSTGNKKNTNTMASQSTGTLAESHSPHEMTSDIERFVALNKKMRAISEPHLARQVPTGVENANTAQDFNSRPENCIEDLSMNHPRKLEQIPNDPPSDIQTLFSKHSGPDAISCQHTHASSYANEVLITSDAQCHKTCINVPQDTDKIVLEIDIKNVHKGPIITKVTATPNNKLEVEQRQPPDRVTQDYRRLQMTKDISVTPPPRPVSQVKLYTLQSPSRRQVMPAAVHNELKKYVRGVRGHKPNTLVFQAKKVNVHKTKEHDRQGKRVVDFKPKKRDLHTDEEGAKWTRFAVVKDTPNQIVPPRNCYSLRHAIRKPKRPCPKLAKDVSDKTYSDVHPPREKDENNTGSFVFRPSRCCPEKVKPNCGACKEYLPLEKPTCAACTAPRILEDIIFPKKRDTFYAKMFNQPLPIDECPVCFDWDPNTLACNEAMARKREHMAMQAEKMRQQAEIRARCEKEMKEENQTACVKDVDYNRIQFDELVHCDRAQSERHQHECFKALTAHWNHVNRLKRRRQRARRRKPPIYTRLRNADGTSAAQCCTTTEPGVEITPDYADRSESIATGPAVRRQWRRRMEATQRLVNAQQNPNCRVSRDKTARQLCTDFDKNAAKFKITESGYRGPQYDQYENVCTFPKEGKEGKEVEKDKKSDKQVFVKSSILPLAWCSNFWGSKSTTETMEKNITFDPDDDTAVDMVDNKEHRMVDLLTQPVYSLLQYALPSLLPKVDPAPKRPGFRSAKPLTKRKLKEAVPESNNEQPKVESRAPNKMATSKIAEDCCKYRHKYMVDVVAGYLSRLFPNEPVAGPSREDSKTVMPHAAKQYAFGRVLRHVLEERDRARMRLIARQEKRHAIHDARHRLKDANKLLDEIRKNLKSLEDKIKSMTQMNNAKQRETRAHLQRNHGKLTKAKEILQRHVEDQVRRIGNASESKEKIKGEKWSVSQQMTKTSENLDKLRQKAAGKEMNVIEKAQQSANDSINVISNALKDISNRENLAALNKHVKNLAKQVHAIIHDPQMMRTSKNLESSTLENKESTQRNEIKRKTKELKDQLHKLKELAKKAASTGLGAARKQNLNDLKAAAEEKQKEIKKLLDEAKRRDENDGKGKK